MENFKNIMLISGSSNLKLSKGISKYLNIPLTRCILDKFKNDEIRIEIHENIRRKNIVIVQSGYTPNKSKSTNDILMETILLIDACRRSSVKSITLIMPLYPYSRQDRKDSSRVPISASIVARMLETAGVNRVVCMDLHSPQIQGFFKCSVDNLYSIKLVQRKLNNLYYINDPKIRQNYILIAPDAGAVKRTFKFASIMGMKTCLMHKERDYSKPGIISKNLMISECKNFKGYTAIIVDDMIDSGGTFIKACETLINKGFKDVIGVISHGYFTGDALIKIMNCDNIKKIIVTNSICQDLNIKICPKIDVIDISEQLGETIKRIHDGGSLSDLF